MTADARVVSSCLMYFGLARNPICPGLASSRVLTDVMSMFASPTTVPPICFASSSSRMGHNCIESGMPTEVGAAESRLFLAPWRLGVPIPRIMAYLLGIDIGTSGTKPLICDDEGTVLATAMAEHPISSPKPGWSEQNPEDWWSAACKA